MTPSEAVRYINAWLTRNGYSGIFKQDVSLILSDNRRLSRCSNVIKYSRIPFSKDSKGRISYRLEDLQTLCDEILKPICSIKLAIKLAKSSGLKYYTPYKETREGLAEIAAAEARQSETVKDADLDQLLCELV